MSCNDNSKPSELVDPFIGTGGHGHTFPGASAPFGMIQISPDTRLTGWDGCSGYHYSDSILYGFSHTHLSGTGVSDYGDFLLSPQVGKFFFNRGNDTTLGYRASFSHANEKASPGHYSVIYDNGIKVQAAAGKRAGIYQMLFAESKAYLCLDLTHRDELLDFEIELKDSKTLVAFRRSKAWATDQRVYFAANFNIPVSEVLVSDKILKPESGLKASEPILGLGFELGSSKKLEVKVAISPVSAEGALENLKKESGDHDFFSFLDYSRALWASELGKIKIDGGERSERVKFYSALYHTMLAPNLYSDVSGKYRGRDLEVHQGPADYYTVFSLWDTYRTFHPLMTLIDSARTENWLKTLLDQYDKGGSLPVWELSANETMCMIGYHSVPVLADAAMKGYKGIDWNEALEASINSANLKHLGIPYYKAYGFIPAGKEPESVSKTLEYAYDDWCISKMAEMLGKDSIAEEYRIRSRYWMNLFDPETGFFRPKVNNGFITPFYPAEVNFHFTEANAWHYGMYVPHDLPAWIEALGGRDQLEHFLDTLFSTSGETTGRNQADITGLIGQYAQGNEPSQHMAYLYNWTQSPYKTQKMVREILDLYETGPEGLPGNEDCGQMSAWYVMASMGLYPVCPGSNQYEISSPLFGSIEIEVGKGRTFKILAKDLNKENIYIQALSLNGESLSSSTISHEEIKKGGVLEFSMGPEPSNWGLKQFESRSLDAMVPVPYLTNDMRSFKESAELEIRHVDAAANIYFSKDGGYFNEYVTPIFIDRSTDLRFYAEKGGLVSPVLRSKFNKIPAGRKIALATEYANQYSAGGNDGLIDGIRSEGGFSTGDWQGYHGVNLEAVIDLGEEKTISSVSTGFIQDWNSWIFFPKQVQVFSSFDSLNWELEGVVFNKIDIKEPGSLTQDFKVKSRFKARFIKVIGFNRGRNPQWHRAPGDTCWIFADEISIELLGSKAGK